MLTPDELERLPKNIEKLMSNLELELMYDIIRKIKRAGTITRATDYQIYKLYQIGESKKAIKLYIQHALELSDEELDNLYEQFLNEEYDNILKLSPPTGIMNIASISNSIDNVVSGTVLCKTEQEKQWIEKRDKKLNCIIGNLIGFDIKNYDTIYIKELYSLTVLKQESIKLKNIIFPKFLFLLKVFQRYAYLPLS